MNEIKNSYLGESYYSVKHKSGLSIYLYPRNNYSSTYAIFGTSYGSIDETFKTSSDKEFTTVPSGIAHFLEHKLFESEDGDAFSRYAKTGASANAYTSFDKTCYLFSCTDNFLESLEILLDFVQSPYFTEETVKKEQGIIGQEIKMYNDSADWQVFFNLLGCLYNRHPIRTDIAGTVESIAEITAKTLYKCYDTFYNLNNMALCVAGKFEPDEVLAMCGRMLKPSQNERVTSRFEPEPASAAQPKIVKAMPVSVPQFNAGFKLMCGEQFLPPKQAVSYEILVELLFSDISPLYRRLLDANLINSTFQAELFDGRSFQAIMAGGESSDPDRVFDEIKKEIALFKERGIDKQSFDNVKKAKYGRLISSYNSNDRIANALMDAHFAGRSIYDGIDAAMNVSTGDVERVLADSFDDGSSAISIIMPVQ